MFILRILLGCSLHHKSKYIPEAHGVHTPEASPPYEGKPKPLYIGNEAVLPSQKPCRGWCDKYISIHCDKSRTDINCDFLPVDEHVFLLLTCHAVCIRLHIQKYQMSLILSRMKAFPPQSQLLARFASQLVKPSNSIATK